MLKKESLSKSSFSNLLTSLIAKAGNLIFTIILARILMPDKFGMFSILISIVTIAFTIFDLGINQTFVKFYSEKNNIGEKEAHQYYLYLRKIKLKTTVLSLLSLAILSYPLSKYLFNNEELFIPLLLSSMYLFTLLIDSFYSHFFIAVKKLNNNLIKETINQLSRILIVILIFLFLDEKYYLLGAVFSIIISSFLSIVYVLFNKNTNQKFNSFYPEHVIDKKEILKFSLFVALVNIANSLLFYLDSIILGIFVEPSYVGYYRTAFSLVLGITGLCMSPVLIILPYLLELNLKKQIKILRTYTKLIALFTIPSSFALIVLGKYFIILFFGRAYLLAYYPLAILSLLIFPQVMVSGLFYNIFASKNSPKLFFREILITTLLNILLNLIVVTLLIRVSQTHAVIGASLACFISWMFYFISTYRVIKKKFNIDLDLIVLIKPILASIVMSGLLYLTLEYFKDINLITGFIEILIGVSVYFICLIILKFFDKNEIENIKSILIKNKPKISLPLPNT